MKTKRILKLLLTALYVVINNSYKNEKEAEKYKRLETIVILQVSIEVVLIASVI